MARRDFQSTVADSLPRVLKEQAKNATGSIKFTQKDRKTIGKVYVKDGDIYALEMTSYVPKIVNRIVTNEYITDSNREQVLQQFGENVTNMEVVNFVVKYQLFPEKPLITYLKDYFFDAFDDLYKWGEVTVEWRAKEEAPATAFRVPSVSPQNVFEKLTQREVFLRDEVSREWSVHPKDLDDVRYRRNFEYNDPDYTNMLILTLAESDEYPIGYVADYLGLPKFNAKLALYNLWKTGAVDVFNPSGLWYSSRSDEEINKTERQTTKTVVQQKYVEETPAEEEFVIETTVDMPVEEFYAPTTAPVSELAPNPIVPVTESFLNLTSPASSTPTPPAGSDAPAELPLPEPAAYDLAYDSPSPATIDDTAPLAVEDYDTTDFDANKDEETFMSDPSAPRSSAAAQLRALKEQLKAELVELQQNIQAEQVKIETKTSSLHALHTERNALVAQLKEKDKHIATETILLNEAKGTIAKLQQEYEENKNLL